MFTFGYILAEPDTETPSSSDTNFPWSNAAIYGALKIHYRSLVQTEVTIVCDFGTAQSLVGLMLEDVNFTSVTIQGANYPPDWNSPSFTQDFTISKNAEIQRYNIWCALTAFNYRYLRIKIPTQTPVDLSVFRIGRRTFIESAIEQSPTWGFSEGGAYPEPAVNEFKSGRKEKISNGSYKIWSGDFTFDVTTAESADLWILDSVEPDDYIAFYKNFGDTSDCYLCQKETPLTLGWPNYQMRQSNAITLREVV